MNERATTVDEMERFLKDGLLLDRRGGLVIAGIGTFGWLCLGLLVRLEMVRGARCVC